jgi:hypothetical protein
MDARGAESRSGARPEAGHTAKAATVAPFRAWRVHVPPSPGPRSSARSSSQYHEKFGGERGIRTPDTLAGTPDFESGAFSRSASSPYLCLRCCNCGARLLAQRQIRALRALDPGGAAPPGTPKSSLRSKLHPSPSPPHPSRGRSSMMVGGEGGIRTLDTLPYTRFPSVRLRPLGHLSISWGRGLPPRHFRFARKKERSSSPHSAASTPVATSTR